MEHLFESERDRKLLLSWMAHIVQTGERVNWAPIIQGAEGDGKTFFYLLMGAVLGGPNVKTVPGEALSEKNTAWAEGAQFCLIEEVRLHGSDRYAIVNKVKPYITNVVASIRRMRTDWYDVINTVSYILTTNHKDGMPAKDSDRYFPMFSRFQTNHAVREFKRKNPNYYPELHEVLKEAGALRLWLMEYELHEDFSATARAAYSASRAEMEYLNMSEEDEAFDIVMELTRSPLLCETLLDSALLGDAMLEHDSVAPVGKAMKMMLTERGFAPLGRISVEGATRRLWSQTPHVFKNGDGEIDNEKVRKFARQKDFVNI